MKFAFFGSSILSAYWNGAATYYRGLLKALSRRGHEVMFCEPDAYGRQEHRDIDLPDWCRVVVFQPTPQGMEQALGEAGRWADILVKCSGIGVLDRELEEAIATQSRPGLITLFWDVDAPSTLDHLRSHEDDAFRALIPRFDAVFTYGGGDRVVAAYQTLGARRCVPIYNAVDPDTHHPVPREARFEGDLAFLGNRLPDREARVEAFFLAPALCLPNCRFILGGSGWESRDLPPNVTHVGHVYTRDHNAFNCSPKAVLNINRDSMARYGSSPATRIFEAAGAGAVILSDRWEGIETFLEPGKEILLADDGAQVAELVAALRPEDARRIGSAARRRVLADHTYAHRAQEVETVLDGRTVWSEVA